MKKSIIAVLAVFLAAALFIGAGSAITLFPYTNVTAQDNALQPGDTLFLLSGSDVSIKLLPISGETGAYFTTTGLVAGTYSESIGSGTTGNPNYVVSYPDAQIDISLFNVPGSDMNGKTVSKSSGLNFTVTPLVTGYYPTALLFTTPAGGQRVYLGDASSEKAYSATDNVFSVESLSSKNVASGAWKVQAKMNSSNFMSTMPSDALNGKTVYTFTVATTVDELTADKDSVVRGNSFIVTVKGTPGQYAYLDIDNAGLYLPSGQANIIKTSTIGNTVYSDNTNYVDGVQSKFISKILVQIPASGEVKIQLDTGSKTSDKTYKITGQYYDAALLKTDSKPSVTVKVIKGAVTVSASADSFYIGNEITLSGTNTETGSVYLYIKGSNKLLQLIPTETGAYLTGANANGITAGHVPSNNAITVNSDNTWSKKFTIANKFDAGTYTIYASSEAYDAVVFTNKSNTPATTEWTEALVTFNDAIAYDTVAVTLKQPFLSATAASSTIAKGDKIKITGTVEGTPAKLIYYVFGTNYYDYGTITPKDDGSYEKKIETEKLATGQYFVVVQHPMYDKLFNVQPGDLHAGVSEGTLKTQIYSYATDEDNKLVSTHRDLISDITSRQIANAAQAVCELIDEEYVDDIYVKLDFVVANAYVTINSVGDQTQGASFKVSGTTNVAVDEDVTIDVISTKFQAEPKASVSAASYLVQKTKVVAGSNGVNTYSATFDGTPLAIDAYTAVATIARSNEDLKVSTTFNIIKGAATPVPSTTGTAAPTTTAVPTQTSTPAKTPGFGALIALAGLGAVAVLVLRRQ